MGLSGHKPKRSLIKHLFINFYTYYTCGDFNESYKSK